MRLPLKNLWHDTLENQFESSELKGNIATDVVIIGGGFTGLSAALHMSQQGVSVCIIEANTIGFGGSGRNVGYVNAGLWTPPDEVEAKLGKEIGSRLNTLLADGPQTVFDLIEHHQIQCGATRQATMHCSENASGLRDLKRRFEQQISRGAPVKLLSHEETAKRTGSQKIMGALWDPRAGTIQPLAYAQGLAKVAHSAGAQIYEHSAAQSASHDGNNWIVETSNGSVTAKKMVQATNAYGTKQIHQNEFIPMNYFQMATAPLSSQLRKRILPGGEGCWDCAAVMSSFRLDPEGRMLIGAIGNLEDLGASIHQAWAKRKLDSLFPELSHLCFERAWSGRIALTSDHLPKVVRIGPNAVSIFGYSGRGIAPGTVFGKCAAEWVISGDEAKFPIKVTGAHIETFKRSKSHFYEFGAAFTHLIGDRNLI